MLRLPRLAATMLLLATCCSAGPAAARPAKPHRPADAPLLGTAARAPRLPPEYLQHDHGGIRFAYHPSARDRVRAMLEVTQQVRDALRDQLGRPVLAAVDVRVAVNQSDVARILPVLGGADPATTEDASRAYPRDARAPAPSPLRSVMVARSSLALSELDMLVINLGADGRGSTPDPVVAFRHGMAHLALDEAVSRAAAPKWFHEGFAASFEDGDDWHRGRQLGWAALGGALVPVADLDWYDVDGLDGDPLARAEAADFVAFLRAKDHHAEFRRLVPLLKQGKPLRGALAAAYRKDPPALERQWRVELAKRKVFLPTLMLGVLVGLLLVAVGFLLRRWRGKRSLDRLALTEAQQAARRLPQRVAVVQVERGVERAARASELPIGEPAESGVPKVSHDGGWHTLH